MGNIVGSTIITTIVNTIAKTTGQTIAKTIENPIKETIKTFFRKENIHQPFDGDSVSGIILLGNAGDGKSFLANILLREDVFIHKCDASSVTHVTEVKYFRYGQRSYGVFNVPGLIGNDPAGVDQNKTEIQKAFDRYSNSIIAYVFSSGAGGRLLEQDLAAFKALNAAYRFEPESLMFIVNDLPTNHSTQYDARTTLKLEHLLKIKDAKVCFLDRINTNRWGARKRLREEMLDLIALRVPHVHKKHCDVILSADIIKKLEADLVEQQLAFDKSLESSP